MKLSLLDPKPTNILDFISLMTSNGQPTSPASQRRRTSSCALSAETPETFQSHSEKLLINHWYDHMWNIAQVSGILTPFSDTQKIERIQRQAARYVTGDYRRSSSVSEMLHNLKWTNLSTRRSVNRLTMIYNILNGHSAITPNNFFEFNRTQTRKKHNLTLRTYQPRGNIDKFASVQRSIPKWFQTLLFKPTRRSSSGSCSRNT